MLSSLALQLQQSLSLLQKQDIQTAAQVLKQSEIPLGDDCAAIPDGEGYLLLAAEGMSPQFLETDPWFAGWSAIMVNVSDIYGMGGYPIAVVDTIWSQSTRQTAPIWEGMKAASQAYQVPIVGGHTNCHSPYNALSVAILGRAKQLISSFNAQSGDLLLFVADFHGEAHPIYPFWNAATEADPARLRGNLALLPHLATTGLCDAGKDISMGDYRNSLDVIGNFPLWGDLKGRSHSLPERIIAGTLAGQFSEFWLPAECPPPKVDAIRSLFHACDLVCEVVGEVQPTQQLILRSPQESIVFWDLSEQKLTGFS